MLIDDGFVASRCLQMPHREHRIGEAATVWAVQTSCEPGPLYRVQTQKQRAGGTAERSLI